MQIKYYTQFLLNDAEYWGGNEFSGIVELDCPSPDVVSRADICSILASNFDIPPSDVELISFSRLH